jgi:hypothetical protein
MQSVSMVKTGKYTVPYKYRYSLSKDTERTTDGKYVVYHRGERKEIETNSVEFYGNITSELLTRAEFNELVKGTKGIVNIVGKFKDEEMDAKFYVPDISEFHVGFECEIKNSSGEIFDWEQFRIIGVDDAEISYDGKNWSRMDWSFYDSLNSIRDESIRVKYLDKADIEELGFIHRRTGIEGYDEVYMLEEKNITLIHSDHFKKVHLYNKGLEFNGFIKNKSELKKILKQLDIM